MHARLQALMICATLVNIQTAQWSVYIMSLLGQLS